MKGSLQLRLSQHLALTPQLQQSIRLLQLSTLELHQEVQQMLEANPFLEPDQELDAQDDLVVEGQAPSLSLRDHADPPSAASEGFDAQSAPAWDGPDGDAFAAGSEVALGAGSLDDAFERLPEMAEMPLERLEPDAAAYGVQAEDFEGLADGAYRVTTGERRSGDEDDADAGDNRAGWTDLASHLRAQIAGLRLCAEDAAAVQVLIESLDADGYLADELPQIAAAIGPDLGEEAMEDLLSRLRCALHWLQRMDPAGVGARSLPECLMLQLRQGPQTAAQAVALAICEGHLEALARRDIRRLMAATGADEALVRQAQALIVACEPKPGRPFADLQSQIIVPDVIVQRAGRGLRVTLNPDVLPRLRINDLYASAVRGHRGGPIAARLQEARWFMKNIQQRFDTILRVSQAIVERQRAFFNHGEVAMRPLVLREIADELGLHESTISRVTTAKYMTTPQGTFELKYFFGSSLATEAGGNASSTAVRALIRQMVAAEDARRPLSDSAISKMLEEQGIQVARRTVAKYREALRIAPASQRRTL